MLAFGRQPLRDISNRVRSCIRASPQTKKIGQLEIELPDRRNANSGKV
jgi:hypothetical protein